MGTSSRIQSSHIRFGKRTFFFDVHQSASNKKFLRVTQSQFNGEGKDRTYSSFVLFPDDIQVFQKTMEEAAGALQ